MTVTEKKKRRATYSKAFNEGYLSCMSIVAAHDAEVIWREAVASNGGYRWLRKISERLGSVEFDGFEKFRER